MRVTFKDGPLNGWTRDIPAADGTDKAGSGTLAMSWPDGINPGDPLYGPRYVRVYPEKNPPPACPGKTVVYRNAGGDAWEFVGPDRRR